MIADELECENSFEAQFVVDHVGGELVVSQQFEQNDFHWKRGVTMPNAVSPTGWKRNVTARMTLRDILWQKVVRIEEMSFLAPNILSPMQCVDVEH